MCVPAFQKVEREGSRSTKPAQQPPSAGATTEGSGRKAGGSPTGNGSAWHAGLIGEVRHVENFSQDAFGLLQALLCLHH